MRYRAEIDGMRALAVALVVAYHAKLPGFAGGFIGVDVFLVLSGYLIASLIRNEVARSGQLDVIVFLARRVRRLLPLILLVGLATALAGWFFLIPHEYKDFGQSLAASTVFLANWLFWREAGYFGTAVEAKPLLHFWSLALEGQFYVLMAGLGWLWARAGTPPTPWLLALTAISFGLGVVGSSFWPTSAFYHLPFRFWEFAAGALIALTAPDFRRRGLGSCGLVLLAAGLLTTTGATPYPGLAATLPVAGTMCLLWAAGPLQRLLMAMPLVALGRISYGVYLWHFPVFALGLVVFPGWPVWIWIAPVLLLAALTWLLVEEPFRRQRDWGRSLRPMFAGLATAWALGIGLHVSGGAPWRLPEPARAPLAYQEVWALPCHDQLDIDAIKAGRTCRIGASDIAPTMAFLGDSHTGHLMPALDRMLAEEGRAGVVFSRGWCAPLPGFGTRAPTRGRDCGDFMDAAWTKVAQAPAIRTVVLAAQWANFTVGAREGLAPVTYGTANHPEDNPRVFDAAMRQLAEALQARGLRVVLVEPVPEYSMPVPDTIIRTAWFEDKLMRVAEPVPFVPRNADALATLSQFAARTGAEVIRPVRLLCNADADVCQIADIRGAPLYRDRGHLSSAGAAVVAAEILEALE